MFGLKQNKYEYYFYPLEVVGRGCETQFQVVEKIKKIQCITLRVSR